MVCGFQFSFTGDTTRNLKTLAGIHIKKKNCCYLSCFFWLSLLEVWHNDQNCKANMGRNGKIIFAGVIKNTSKDLKFQINVKKMKAISLMEANEERISAVITFYVCLPDRINLDTFLKSNCMFFSVKILSKIIFIFYVCDRFPIIPQWLPEARPKCILQKECS